MDFLTSPLHVTDSNDLETIESLLHDESFDLDGVCFDEEVGEVTIPVRIQFHSGPERLIHKGLFFNTYEKEWEHSLVTIPRCPVFQGFERSRDKQLHIQLMEPLW